jgi:NAD(P)-dependent dehydrogenase (short-subunit alcohol dehydrogenase family)
MTERTGKTYLITGGVSGLGYACAKMLHGEGANVILLDMNKDKGAEVIDAMGADRAMFHVVDVRDQTQIQAAIDAGMEKFGGLHGVINCAGLGSATLTVGKNKKTGELEPHNPMIFDYVMQVNLYGTFNCSALGAKAMAQTGHNDGVIVNVASVAGIEGQKGQLAYSASKGGVIGMTLPMARDLARYGIRVCTIAPGIMDTPLMQMASEKVRGGLLAQVAGPKRFGQDSEFASLTKQIIDNGYLNGETIRIDGGIRFANL